MKLDYDSTEPDVRIELVPLIDVIFCILTFFILAAVTLTRQAAINVDLPRAASGTTQLRQILIVSVDAIGQTYVEKSPVSKDQLLQAILGFRQQNPEGHDGALCVPLRQLQRRGAGARFAARNRWRPGGSRHLTW